MSIKKVGVIGAGVMGTGLSQNLAHTGHQVILLDVSDQILERARDGINKGLRFQSLFNKGRDAERPEDVMERIHLSTDLQSLQEADFVIENVTEDWQIKRELYQRVDSICPEDRIFAANTSAIPITRIASATKRASRVIGIHFMNPVPMKRVVEVIRGYHTSDDTLEQTKKLLAAMGKESVVVNDAPGFVSNRVLMLTINEAIFLLQEGVASVRDIDLIFKECFGHKMGPLETADLIGLDTILLSIEVLHESFGDSKYRPCPMLKKMVDAGVLGRKTGQGFYPY
jgi:3-hydroxybutyryl-CoA dehydrogenase